jgi:hypothetical protein
MYTTVEGPEHWHVANARSRYGACLMRLGRYEQAETQLLSAHRVLASAGITEVAQLTASRLVDLYVAWGKDEQEARWRTSTSVNESSDGSPAQTAP